MGARRDGDGVVVGVELKQWAALAAWEIAFIALTAVILRRKDRAWSERRAGGRLGIVGGVARPARSSPFANPLAGV